jgi:hypothetical protein
MSYKLPLVTSLKAGTMEIGSGLAVSNGVVSVTPVALFNQAYFYDTTTQTNPVAGDVNVVNFNTIGSSFGITLVAGSQITVSKTANYNFQFTAQVTSTSGGVFSADFWILRNGVAYPNTNTTTGLSTGNNPLVASWNLLLGLTAGDEIQLVWQSGSTGLELLSQPAQVAPIRPVTPSARVTILQL